MKFNNSFLTTRNGTIGWKIWRLPGCLVLGSLIPLTSIGCTHDHKIDLHPEILVRPSSIGEGKILVIQVRDTRSQNAISKKETGPRLKKDRALNTVNIYASSSVRDTVQDKIMEGFQRLGFRPIKHQRGSGPILQVDISRLQLKYQSGNLGAKIPEVHAQMKTILRVRATHGSRSFKNVYQSRMTKSHRMFTGKFTNERLVNNSLSLALQHMFEDAKLVQFLASGLP
jgi:uncharacterized lipoprotein YajG